MSEKTETPDVEAQESAGQRVDPILEHLDAGDAEVDKTLIRKKFIDIWQYEDGDKLDDEGQYLTLI